MDKKIKHNTIKSCLERPKIRMINSSRVNDAEQELDLLFGDEGVMIFAVKDVYWQQWSFKKEKISNAFLHNLIGLNKDSYVAINSFKTHKRLLSNLFGLNALWVDLDFYKVPKYNDKSYSEMINILSKNKLIKQNPPSFYIFSGQGLYPIWLIEAAHAGKCLALWQRLMKELHKELGKYGADPKSNEAAHVLRIAGTTNTKTGKVAKIVDNGYDFNPIRYSLDSLAKTWLPALTDNKEYWAKINSKKKKTKKDKEACKTKSLYNVHSLNYARMQDIQTLIEVRNGNCIGHREFLLFLYRYWGNCFFKDSDKALAECLELNKMFEIPLCENEVISATKRAEVAGEIWEDKVDEYWAMDSKPSVYTFFKNTGCYVYSNKTLIKELCIEQEEMVHLKTMFNTKEKNRRNKDYRREYKQLEHRNANGVTNRKQSKIDKINAILEFKEKKMTQKDMAEKLGCSIKTIEKYVKEIKENNLVKQDIQSRPNQVIELVKATDTELKLMVV